VKTRWKKPFNCYQLHSLSQAQAALLTEAATSLEVPISHINDLIYIIRNKIHVNGTTSNGQDEVDEEIAT
jgi:hypothetical protein